MNIRKNFDDHRRAWYGVAGMLVILALLAGVIGFANAGIGKQTLTGDFAQAGGIRAGDQVRVAGINKGQVTKTELAGDHVKITMKVDNDVRVTSSGSAEIKMSTLLGQRFVDVSLGDAPDRAKNGHIESTSVPYDLQQTIEAGTPILAAVDDKQFAKGLKTINEQLKGAPAVTRPTLDALTQMSKIITNRKDQINQLIADTKSVTAVVNDSQGQLAVIVGQGQQLAGKIVARQALVQKLLDGLAALTEQAKAVAAENSNQFAPILANINTVTQGLEKNRDNLRKLLEILPVTTRLTNNVIGDGPYANGFLPWGIFPDNWLCLARVVDGC